MWHESTQIAKTFWVIFLSKKTRKQGNKEHENHFRKKNEIVLSHYSTCFNHVSQAILNMNLFKNDIFQNWLFF